MSRQLNFDDKFKGKTRSAADELMAYRPKFEDKYTRRTLWVRNDLLKKLDETGNRKETLEEALEAYFEGKGSKR